MSDASSRFSVARKVFAVLDPDQRRAAGGLFLLMLVGMAVAKFDGVVAAKTKGMQAFFAESAKSLFGGQRLRACGALKFYCAPPTWVFDDAPGALVVVAEAEVARSTAVFDGRETAATAAQGRCTTDKCDRMYCLEPRQVVQAGLPAEVLNQLVRTADAAVPSVE